MIRCQCKYCAQNVERRASLRRRNPDDLETLEKIAQARRLYLETKSINAVVRAVFGSYNPDRFYMVKGWVQDLLPENLPSNKAARRAKVLAVYRETDDVGLAAASAGVTERTARNYLGLSLSKKERTSQRTRQRAKARSLYEQGLDSGELPSFTAIGKQVGVNRTTVRKWVADLIPPKPTIDPRIKKARQVFLAEGTIKAAAEAVNASYPTVSIWVEDLYEEQQQQKLERAECFETHYAEGLSDNEIARRCGATPSIVATWRKNNNLPSKVKQGYASTTYRELYDRGLSDNEIAEQAGVTRVAVKTWRNYHKLPANRDERSPKTDQYQELYEQGLTDAEIGRRTSRSKTVVGQWRKKRGLPRNRKPPRRRNPAQTLNPSIGVALLGELGARGIVLFDLSKTHSEQDIWGDDALLSYIYFGWEDEALCPANRYVAQKAVAKHGWGPVAFELAMHVTVKDGMEGLVPDRREISDDGFAIWKRFYQRDDINKQPLTEGALWGEDYLDSVYTLQHKPRYYFHKHRANKRLQEIFPYPGEAETHLWEAAEAWFSSEFDGGRYRPSTPKGQRRNPDDLETLEKIVEARRLYKEGVRIQEIRKVFDVPRRLLNTWLEGLEDPRIEEAKKLYKEGHSISWISKQLQANAYKVKEWVAGLEQMKPKNTRREQAIKLYQEGHNVGEIAKELGAARTTVKRWVRTLMLEYVKKEQARELYHDGEDITDIAQKLGVPRDDVVSWVADLYYRYDPETFEVWYDPPQ